MPLWKPAMQLQVPIQVQMPLAIYLHLENRLLSVSETKTGLI